MKVSFLSLFIVIACAGTTPSQDLPKPAKKITMPVFTSHENTRVHADSLYSYKFNAYDSSGLPLTFDVSVLPSWLTYSAKDKILKGTAPGIGQYPVVITATNGSLTAHQPFMITVFNAATMNILPLGNSITNGTDKFDSYRRALWQKLNNDNYNFDLIGSWSRHHLGGDVPDPDFDLDHEGHSGWTFAQMLAPPDWDSKRGNLNEWIQTYSPDVVLVELGTNDVFQCVKVDDMLQQLTAILTILRTRNSHVKIFVAQIPPLGPRWASETYCGGSQKLDDILKDLNSKLVNYSTDKSLPDSPITVVDQYSGIDPAVHQYDDIHPNAAGEEIMAQRWFEAIKGYIGKK